MNEIAGIMWALWVLAACAVYTTLRTAGVWRWIGAKALALRSKVTIWRLRRKYIRLEDYEVIVRAAEPGQGGVRIVSPPPDGVASLDAEDIAWMNAPMGPYQSEPDPLPKVRRPRPRRRAKS